ncbi:winged helix-turn-helix domain-containing protein [Actinoplanes bogorensis]|uniref:Winged helix-turn-helix domain-containing protein n=1 Tax=Paractinoplanes bogorensis TaxID=1610840 RepID=A0ABS5Z1Z9_9ACTN|nr:winged helix-turn-helix domain-containing protein [Actinoplanes bogorensis]MBU2669710.1 winged helix-turn-helix domain-containing protein [Actinoplanes bogorensis]
MIRIEIDEPTLSRTRIAISPLAEVACSVFLLQRNPATVPWPYEAWARRARALTGPVSLYFQLSSVSPDFLIPPPLTAMPTIGEQLDQLRDTSPAVIESELAKHYPDGDLPELIRPFRDDQRAALGRLADGVQEYWDTAIAPYWPVMRAALDEEVLLRARALAADGPDALLSRLHERISWERPVLTLKKPLEQSFEAVNQRLLLVPLIFSRGALMCSGDQPDLVMVTYQSRGAAVLAETPAPPLADDRLSILLGRGRAAVLRALSVPATTTGLATTLGLAPSTISEHLGGLLAAGVVHRRRAGRRVLYGLEPAGTALVTLLGEDSARTEFVS